MLMDYNTDATIAQLINNDVEVKFYDKKEREIQEIALVYEI